MTWDYNVRVNALDLSDIATFATIETEAPSAYFDPGVLIPGREGVQVDDEAPIAPLIISLRVHFRWTDEAGTVTHPNGAAGHIHENLSLFKRELFRPAPIVRRNDPHAGQQRAVVKATTPGFVGEQRHIYHFPLMVPSGSWQSNDEESDTGSPATGVTTTGDVEIYDPRVSLPSAGTRTVTTAEGLVYAIVAAVGPTYPVVIDVGAGSAVDDGSDDALGSITFDHDHWFRLSPNHTHVITGSGTWFWRDRWA